MKIFNLKIFRGGYFLLLIWLMVLVLISCTSVVVTPLTTINETTSQATVYTTASQTPISTTTSPAINYAPLFVTIGDKEVPQGNVMDFTLGVTDPEGDYLTINASNLPIGSTFNNLTGYFHWIPPSIGIYPNVSFTVSDGQHTISQNIVITVVPNIPTLINSPSQGTPPLIVFYYGSHTPIPDSRILAVRPRYVIINSANGLWGHITGRGVLKDLSEYKEAGIKVIGYITSGYEDTGSAGNIDAKWYTLEKNMTLITQMAEIDHVDGVFIDECSPFPGQMAQAYLKNLTDLAHSYGLITWGNVGLDSFDSWFFTKGGFDLMQSGENWHAQQLTQIQKDWGYRISVTGTNPAYTAQDALRLTLDAREKGLAYCYFTDTGYDSLPPWFEEYVTLQKGYKLPIGN